MLKDPGDSEERPEPRGFAGGNPLLSWLLTLPPAGRLTRNPATPTRSRRGRAAAARRRRRLPVPRRSGADSGPWLSGPELGPGVTDPRSKVDRTDSATSLSCPLVPLAA